MFHKYISICLYTFLLSKNISKISKELLIFDHIIILTVNITLWDKSFQNETKYNSLIK